MAGLADKACECLTRKARSGSPNVDHPKGAKKDERSPRRAS